MKDYYKTLMVHPEADTEIIKAAYRRLAQLYHPDVYRERDAEARMKEINEAYETLLDPEKRFHYDRERRLQSIQTEAPAPSPPPPAVTPKLRSTVSPLWKHRDLLKIIAISFVVSLIVGLLVREALKVYRQRLPVNSVEFEEAKKLIDTGEQKALEMRIRRKPGLLSAKDGDGRTLLRYAAERGNLPAARFIIDRGVDVNDGTKKANTPLHAAAYKGYLDMTTLLITAGALVDARTDRGRTPLHLAASQGNGEIVEYLITKGADVNSRDLSGATPLALAEKYDKSDVVVLLKFYGARD
jgi:curved DNA-binding protein CbpA